MKILAIDTSGQTAGAAIVDDTITMGEVNINTRGKLTHSESLLPMIDHLFTLTRLTLEDMDYLACVSGPGSFTGLRIGAATAQGLARGAKKPLIAVPTLDALAYNIGCGSMPGTYLAPMMDARRSQVYTAFYECGGSVPRRGSEPMAAPVEEALIRLEALVPPEGRVIFFGDGADENRLIIEAKYTRPYTFARANANRQRAASAALCAMHLISEGWTERPFEMTYLRRPQAERVRFGDTAND